MSGVAVLCDLAPPLAAHPQESQGRSLPQVGLRWLLSPAQPWDSLCTHAADTPTSLPATDRHSPAPSASRYLHSPSFMGEARPCGQHGPFPVTGTHYAQAMGTGLGVAHVSTFRCVTALLGAWETDKAPGRAWDSRVITPPSYCPVSSPGIAMAALGGKDGIAHRGVR